MAIKFAARTLCVLLALHSSGLNGVSSVTAQVLVEANGKPSTGALHEIRSVEDPAYTVRTIGKGLSYETSYFVYRGDRPGPTVIVQGGIHGNELAGTYALDALIPRLKVEKGTVIFLPRMNAPAVRKKRRFTNVDLNRVFATRSRRKPYEYRLAQEVMNVIGSFGVEHMVTLHEARAKHNFATKRHYGQTICYGVKPRPYYMKRWLSELNDGLPHSQRFAPFYSPIATSSTEVIVGRYKLKGGFCAETWSGFPLRTRVRLQDKLIRTFLTSVGVRFRLTPKKSARDQVHRPDIPVPVRKVNRP